MTIVRVGSTDKYAEGWEQAFAPAGAAKKTADKTAPAKAAKAKAAPKKSAKKKAKKG